MLIALTAMVLLGALWTSAALGQQPASSTPELSSPGLHPGLPRWRLLNPERPPDG
jgi:hypothetical protein